MKGCKKSKPYSRSQTELKNSRTGGWRFFGSEPTALGRILCPNHFQLKLWLFLPLLSIIPITFAYTDLPHAIIVLVIDLWCWTSILIRQSLLTPPHLSGIFERFELIFFQPSQLHKYITMSQNLKLYQPNDILFLESLFIRGRLTCNLSK